MLFRVSNQFMYRKILIVLRGYCVVLMHRVLLPTTGSGIYFISTKNKFGRLDIVKLFYQRWISPHAKKLAKKCLT